MKSTFVAVSRKVLAAAVASALVFNASANSLSAGPLVTGTDYALFGVSGLRGTGVGTITVSGITGTVTRAILVWHGVATTATPLTRSATVNGTPVSGANIGLSDNNCWGQSSSQAFQADVTSIVTGNGAYNLTSMLTSGTFDANGASLLVYYNDGNGANNRDVAVFWGNDSNIANSFDPAGWQASLTGINYSGGAASLSLIVSDGQIFPEGGTATINAVAFSIPEFAGNTLPVASGSTVTNGGLWDHFTAPVASYLTPGPNTLNFNATLAGGDCLSLISTVFDLPAGAITPQAPTNTAIPTASPLALGGMGAALALWGVYGLRRREKKATR
jgi:hypothetical protein